MCGIAGIVDREHPQAHDLAAMVASIYHRGPDEEGSVTLPFAALGMRRLAIVDLSGGQQPFTNEDQSIYVVTNGEKSTTSKTSSATCRRAGTPFIHGATSRSSPTRTRIRHRVPQPAAGDVRDRALGQPHADAHRRA